MQDLALPQDGRHGGGDYLADRVVIIVARKSNKRQIVLAKQRLVVQHFDTTPNFLARQLRAGRVPDHEAHLAARPKLHEYAASRYRYRPARRGQVIELAGQGYVDRYLEYGVLAV
jgi:hypothetical protein